MVVNNLAHNKEDTNEYGLIEIENRLRDLGKELAEHRKNERISQEEMAKKMGTVQQKISKIENMEPIPSITTLIKYANILGYNIKLEKR